MGPINYAIDIPDPSQAFLQAFKTGTAVTDVRMAQEESQRKAAQQKQIQDLYERLRQPGATARDYANLSMLLPETQAKAVRESFTMLNTDQQQSARTQAGQVFSAFRSGRPEIAIGMIDRQIEAKRNIGDESGAKFLETWRDVAKENPQATEDYFGGILAEMPGGKDVLEAALKITAEKRSVALQEPALKQAVANADAAVADAQRKVAEAASTPAKLEAEQELRIAQIEKEKALAAAAAVDAKYAEQIKLADLKKQTADLEKIGWDIKNLRSQIGDRAERLNLDRLTTTATVNEKLSSIQKNLSDIPADTRKLINESATLAATSKQSAEQFNDLAKRLDASGGGYGVFSSASDFLKKSAGFQGGMTQLRQEYTRLRNTAAIKTLPPGPATDKDIAMALKGFPSDNASATDLSAFLRGMAKLQDVDASINNAKTDWLAQNNGTLTRAKNTFVAGDYSTKPGETFNDFAQRIVGDVSKRYDPTQQVNLVDQIPTDRNPTPAQNNIRSQADAILRGGK